MALAICAQPGFEVALVSAAAPHVLVVARSKDRAVEASAVVRALAGRFGGRGGGRPELAQAGGLTGDLGEVLAAARAELDRGQA
jgi:alanyl-tRNA synthetase